MRDVAVAPSSEAARADYDRVITFEDSTVWELICTELEMLIRRAASECGKLDNNYDAIRYHQGKLEAYNYVRNHMLKDIKRGLKRGFETKEE